MQTEVGIIETVSFGKGGYQGVMIGYNFTLGSKKGAWGCQTNIGAYWTTPEDRLEHCKWTHNDRIVGLGKATWEVYLLMEKAKVDKLEDLVGIPIKAYFTNGALISFEIFEEVL